MKRNLKQFAVAIVLSCLFWTAMVIGTIAMDYRATNSTTGPLTQPGQVIELGSPNGANLGPVTTTNPMPVTSPLYPTGATPATASSGNVAAAAAVATLPAVAAKTTYITGFTLAGGGATAASLVTATLAGIVGGTQSYTFAVPAGATLGANPLVIRFTIPIPASAVNTAIVVTLPSLGAGNTNATANAQGFQL